jgi:hypothetical protein
VSQPRRYVVYGFASTHDALVTETLLREAGVTHRTIPTPASLGDLCGIAIRVPRRHAAPAENVLHEGGCEWNARVTTREP